MQINQLPIVLLRCICHLVFKCRQIKIQNGFRANIVHTISLRAMFYFKHITGVDGRRTAAVFCSYEFELLLRTINSANCDSLRMKNLKSGKSVLFFVFLSFSNEMHLFRCTFCSFIKSVHSSSYFNGILMYSHISWSLQPTQSSLMVFLLQCF